MKRFLTATLACLAIPAAAHAATLDIAPDGAAFWNGLTIASGNVRDASLCDVVAPCPTYTLKLESSGARLRVGLDTPMRDDTFHFDVIDASGAVVGGATNSNQFDVEAFIEKPKA